MDDKTKHADLSRRAQGNVQDTATAAARGVFEAGGSPREQLDAARKRSGNTRLTYLPHQGAKEREKNMARMKARQRD